MNLSLFKSTINGIGSGAGVAWPFFGIVFTLVGGTIESWTSFALGSLALGLFLSICLTIVYLSYKQAQEDQSLFQEQLKKNENKVVSDVQEYIEKIHHHYSSQSQQLEFKDYFSLKLKEDLNYFEKSNKNSLLYKSLNSLKEKGHLLNQVPKAECIIECIPKMSSPNNLNKKALIAAFFDFVGTFGSIAGCSAGFTGMLTGVGLFSSFAAFPILGWAVLAAAAIVGIFAATQAFRSSKEHSQKQWSNQSYKNFHKELSQFNRQNHLGDPLLRDAAVEEDLIKQRRSYSRQPKVLSAPLNFFTPFTQRSNLPEKLLNDTSKWQPGC